MERYCDRHFEADNPRGYGALFFSKVSVFNGSDKEIMVRSVSVNLFANRWSDTMASELESLPKEFGHNFIRASFFHFWIWCFQID